MEGELRCDFKMFGRITDEGLIEVKCNTDRHRHGKDVVVFHYFDPVTAQLKDTQIFRDPASLFANNQEV